MKLTFRQLLSRPDREGRCRVVLDVTWDRQRLKLPTGASCLPAHFTAGALRPVSTKDPASARLNALLSAALVRVEHSSWSRTIWVVVTLSAALVRVEQAALQAVAAGRPLTPADLAPPEKAAPTLPVMAAEFYELWQAHHPTKPDSSRRQYQQVVAHLDAYHPNWAITTLTRAEFQAYLGHLHGLGLADATVTKHVKFLRECLRLADKGVPGWLTVRTRYGRSPALQAQEFRQLLALDLSASPALAQERDLFVLQTLLLLRDSNLRQSARWPGDSPGRGFLWPAFYLARMKYLFLLLGLLLGFGTRAQMLPAIMHTQLLGKQIAYQVGGLATRRAGTPIVVFEGGVGAGTENFAPLLPGLTSAGLAWLTYARPGLSGSDPDPAVRTDIDVMGRLHALLQQEHIAPPYPWASVLTSSGYTCSTSWASRPSSTAPAAPPCCTPSAFQW